MVLDIFETVLERVRFPEKASTDKMSLWIKASAKCVHKKIDIHINILAIILIKLF